MSARSLRVGGGVTQHTLKVKLAISIQKQATYTLTGGSFRR